jgi:hypothetical protein
MKLTAPFHIQPLSSPAAQSAQSAASHAFLKSQTSNASLSSAAAAAALRNLTPTPTSVEDVQTKRMVQRRASVQSQAPLGGRRSVSASGTLRRSSSNSSMSARTFRDQSPSRPLTSSGPISPPTDVPPLPSIPSQYGRKPQNRRAVSMEPSMRAPPASPPRSVARGVDREQGRGSPIHQRVTSLGMLPELERPELERSGSRNSVNFSYPLGSRPTSPAAESPPKTLHEAIQEPIPEEPVREKPLQERSPNRPRAQASGSVEGSPAATRSGRLAGSAAAAALGVTPQKSSPKVTARPEQARDAPVPADPLEQYTGNAKPVAATTKHDYTSSRTLHEGWPSTVREQEEPEDFDRDVDDIQIRQGRNRMTSASPTADHVEAVPAPVAPSSPSELRPEQQQNLRQSSSPGRSARFSQLLQVSGAGDQIHQPPPRSVSPVKSALKHPRRSSSSPDRRLSVTGRVQPSSELSDGTSVASDEGARIGAKKKAHKVSFDDEAEVVGLAASPPTSPEEYTPESPPSNKAKSRMSWLGVGKKKPPMELASDDDWNVVMKPRQELPSFGSIRGSRDGGMKRLPIPDFSDNESSSSSDSDAPSKQKKSSPIEHTFGGILSKPQPTPAEYFPPHDVSTLEQLSVNGAAKPTQPTATPENKFTDEPANRQPDAGVNSDLSVPAIAIEPATPPAEEHKQSFDSKRSSMDQYRIPGGFPPSGSDRSLKSTAKKTQSQVVASAVPTLDDVDTEDEYSDSIYSDAPEDIDIDGDGFGSINAIVDKGSAPRSAPPLETVSESRDATPKPVDRTTISDAPSQNVNVQVPEEVRSVTPTQNSVNRLVEESPASSVGYACEPERSPVSAMPIPRSSPGPDGSPQAQSNTRARPMSVAVDTNGASRMRDPRYSSNDTSPQGGNAKQRPLSVGPAFHKAAGPPIFPSSLRRKTSNGSDSSSSFKRASRRGDAVSMRRTMRAGAGANGQAQPPTERHESPLEHRPMSSGSSNGTMRKTLRGPARGERYSYFSTNNKAPPRAKFTKPPPKSARTTRFANSDDENEDEPRPQFFTSRFADSSDEDQPRNTALRPVRGIPRRKGADDGDSTELEDSSEESARQQAQSGIALGAVPPSPGTSGNNAPPRSMSGMAAVARQRGMSQRDLEEFIMAPPRGRKPGLLTRLGIKKPKNSENRIRKSDIESPSRRDTPLERSRMELDQLRGDGIVTGNYTTVSAGSPEPAPSKLVKRNSKRQSTAPDAWPLPPDAKEPALQPVAEQPQDVPPPPQTIDNVDAARNGSIVANGDPAGASPIAKEPEAHGDLNNDSASEITSPEVQGHSARDVVIAGSGRKKRFPLLRKAFGLRA